VAPSAPRLKMLSHELCWRATHGHAFRAVHSFRSTDMTTMSW
jgi:hypothetical protein